MADSYSSTVQLKSDGVALDAFVSRPLTEGNHPGIIVIQEWNGVVDHIKEVTMRLARQGYVAIAPDLYHGEIARSPDQAMRLMGGLSDPQVVRELNGAVAYLREQGSPRVGVIGFCLGGRLSLLLACHNRDLSACAIYYGSPVSRELSEKQPAHLVDLVGNINCPVLGIYGELDAGIPLDVVGRLRDALQKAGKNADIHTYPGAQHAFLNDTNPDRYHADASRDAWEKTLAFLAANLK